MKDFGEMNFVCVEHDQKMRRNCTGSVSLLSAPAAHCFARICRYRRRLYERSRLLAGMPNEFPPSSARVKDGHNGTEEM